MWWSGSFVVRLPLEGRTLHPLQDDEDRAGRRSVGLHQHRNSHERLLLMRQRHVRQHESVASCAATSTDMAVVCVITVNPASFPALNIRRRTR